MSSGNVSFGTNISVSKKRVRFDNNSGASITLYEGTPVCYNYDTTTNVLGWDKENDEEGTTTAEGYQNEGKYQIVELASSTNYNWLAGYVAYPYSNEVIANGATKWIDIYEPNGAIIPVRTDASCVVGVTILGLTDAGVVLSQSTGDDDPIACAIAMETVDRSSVNGIVLAKVFATGQVIVGNTAYFLPSNYRNGRAYGVTVDGTCFFQGAAGAQEYLMQLIGYKSTAATGDCYGGYLFIKGDNEAANVNTYTFRGLNCSINNRDGGTLGTITNTISLALKQGSTAVTGIALMIDAQDLSENAKTEFGGLDIALNREGLAATTEYGLQIRTRGTIQSAITTAFRVDMQATDYGFSNLFSFDAGSSVGMTTSDGGVSTHKIPILDGTTTRYLMVSDG